MRWVDLGVGVLCGCVFAIGSTPSVADACSPATDSFERVVQPQDGATGVPINASVRLHYELHCTAFTTAWCMLPSGIDAPVLRAVGGALVESTVRVVSDNVQNTHRLTVTVTPTAPLEPFTDYEVLDIVETPCASSRVCVGAPSVAGRFTTSDFADETPPTFVGLGSISGWPESGSSSSECGTFTGVRYGLYWTPEVDDHPSEWLAYEVRDASGRAILLTPGDRAFGFVYCSGAHEYGESALLSGRGPFSVRALDLAQNGSPTTPGQRVETACPPPPADDAGMPDAGGPDAGTEVRDGGTDVGDAGAGCSVSRPGRSPPPWGLVIGGVALLRWRKAYCG